MSAIATPLPPDHIAGSPLKQPLTAPLLDGSYRPDIDGLRALAVVPVVLFHAGLSVFQGGYVGVDIFFVISGFLITRILAASMREDRYSILDFYERRARRIFPALAVMVLASLAFGWFVLTPEEYAKIGKTAVSIGAFVSNFHFWRSVGYFERETNFHPLLHTWSLAVEEQFYIFFPILLYFLHKRHRRLIAALAGIFFLSFASSVALVEFKPRVAFYLLPPRAWELMAGSLIALGVSDRFWSPRAAAAAALLGLALIAGAIFFYTPAMPFPGFAAMPPVLGACLIIWARGQGAGRLLAIRPMVWIGLLSYSLYLWHLPIFEFAKYLLGGQLPPAIGLSLSLVSRCLRRVPAGSDRSPGPMGDLGVRRYVLKSEDELAMESAEAWAYRRATADWLMKRFGSQVTTAPDQARHVATLYPSPIDTRAPENRPLARRAGDGHRDQSRRVPAHSMAATGRNMNEVGK